MAEKEFCPSYPRGFLLAYDFGNRISNRDAGEHPENVDALLPWGEYIQERFE